MSPKKHGLASGKEKVLFRGQGEKRMRGGDAWHKGSEHELSKKDFIKKGSLTQDVSA